MTRPWAGALGGLVLALAWLGPLPHLAGHAFWAHMGLHMAVVAIAAPLLALAIDGGRFDFVRRHPRWFPPIPLSLVELVVVWAWHAPALHRLARHSTLGFAIEQSTFLASGLVLWLAVTSGGVARTAAGIVALLLTSMHMTLLGALLALATRPLYPHHHGSGGGLTALEDQHLGGAIMLVIGGVSYLAGGLGLMARLLAGARARRSS